MDLGKKIRTVEVEKPVKMPSFTPVKAPVEVPAEQETVKQGGAS